MSLKIAFIRGSYLNNFELQSYYPALKSKTIKITGISSLNSKHKAKIPTQKLISPMDLPDFPHKLPVLNRLFIDAMYLHGLEAKLKQFDIAHARETYFHYSFQSCVALKRGNISKVLITCSETIPHNHETIWGRKYFKKFVINSATHFHCITQKAKQCLIDEGADPQKITVIPYGIDIARFKQLKPKKQKNNINLLFIGRLEEQKGVYQLIEVWKKLRKEYSNINLQVVGKGPLDKVLIEQGIIPEHHPYSKMPQIIQQADILIHPPKKDKYWEEYFGMVLLEAMAAKLSIVTTNCGAIPEVVGEAAQIVEQGNSQQLYKAVKLFIDNLDLRNKYSDLGFKRVSKLYDANIQAEKLAKLYLKIQTQ